MMPRSLMQASSACRRRALVRLRNTVDGTNEPAGDTQRVGLGTQLVSAFAMQLGGSVTRERGEGYYDLSVEFELSPLPDEGHRNATGDQSDGEPGE